MWIVTSLLDIAGFVKNVLRPGRCIETSKILKIRKDKIRYKSFFHWRETSDSRETSKEVPI